MKNYECDFKFRSQKRITTIIDTILLPVASLSFLIDFDKKTTFIVIFLCLPVVIEIIMYLIYDIKKPYTLFINGDELTLSRLLEKKRSLSTLTKIRFDRLFNTLELELKSQSQVSIKITEYASEDIKQLFEILIKRSKYDISVPKSY